MAKKEKIKLWSQITAGFAGLAVITVGIAAGIDAYDEYRPFPTKMELRQVETQVQQVAGRSCKNELSFYSQELRDIDRQIEKAVDQKNKSWERTLREQRREVLVEIARVKRECGWS